MSEPLLLVITGYPCTGKTTLGRHIAREFRLPFIHKDGIKETLFESLGWKDRDWSRKLGAATYDLLYYVVETLMGAGVSLVLESNFQPEIAGPKLNSMIEQFDYSCVQLLCKAEGEVLAARFQARAASTERHPGHVDVLNYEEIVQELKKGRIEPLPLAAPLLEINTSVFDVVDYEEIKEAVRRCLTHKKESQMQS